MGNIDQLECVYYPGPVPSNRAVLTALCFVFDKIHFPGVYLPKGDYDREALQQEIVRLETLEKQDYGIQKLIGTLKFLEYRLPLDGILEFPSKPDSIFGGKDDVRSKLVKSIYDINFPPRKNFEPQFDTASSKGLPNSEESVTFAGDFYYQAGAILYAAQKQLPLIDDGSWLPLPFKAQYKDNAPALATLMALESMELVLSYLPVLTTQELVDFRIGNKEELHNFRGAMLKLSQTLNANIAEGMPEDEVIRKAQFIVQSDIEPALYELERDLRNPNRAWYKRAGDVIGITASTIVGVATHGLVGTTLAEGIKNGLLSELSGAGAKYEAAKRNGLYYLLKAKAMRG